LHAGPAIAYIERATRDLHRSEHYVGKVLGEPVVPSARSSKEAQ
jgi:hypothetical protein